MIFTTLEIQNFLSYEQLSFDLNQGGTVLMIGSNGSGKSSIFDAIAWCLFGVTLKGQKGDEVLPLFKPKGTCVILNIEEESSNYQIQRYRKHPEYQNSLRLLMNGEDISGHSNDSTQQHINSLLGMDMRLFTNSVMFAQGFSDFFAALPDEEQKSMIENFIDTQVWDICLKLTKDKLVNLTTEKNRLLQEWNQNASKQEVLQDEYEELERTISNFENQRKEEESDLYGQLRQVTKAVKAKQVELDKLSISLEELEDRMYELEKLKSLSKQLCSKCKQPLPFEFEEELVLSQESHSGLKIEISSLSVQIRTLEFRKKTLLNDLCKVKSRENLTEAHLKKTRGQIKQLSKEARQIDKDVSKLEQMEPVLDFWVEGFGNRGIKNFLFESIIPEFNRVVKEYTEVMTDGEIQVVLTPTRKLKSGETREKFGLEISNTGGSSTRKGSSVGEKRVIDLCILWALQEMSRRKLRSMVSFEVLDEALDTLDDSHIDSVLAVLNKHARYRTVFVVSHNDSLKSSFDQVYLVDKHKRRSQVFKV